MSKTILAVMGSPRKTGLINGLITAFKQKIDELNHDKNENDQVKINILNLTDFNIQHCTGCDSCLRKPHECPLSDNDDMPKIEESMKKADAIVIGSPTYFGSPPAIIKDIIDRSRPMKMSGYQIKDKLFSVISSAGLRDGGNNWVIDSLVHFALIQGMIVVGGLGHPVLEASFPSETLQMQGIKEFRKPSEPGEIALKLSANLAERMYFLLMKN